MMDEIPEVPTAAPPSLERLARTTAMALAAAAVILVTLVLPAEYAIDPLGTGRWLGLTDIASPPVHPVGEAGPQGAALKPVVNGPIGEYGADFKLDVFNVTLPPYEYVEYKYHLEQGATLLYAWKASAPVIHDFHGQREGGAPVGGSAEESFDKQDRREAAGTLTAPFTGIHGWYWENPGGEPITIRLTSSGFYGSAVEIRSDRTRHPRALKTIDRLAEESDAPGGGPR